MPILPSGLSVGLSREALFDGGQNWFGCPVGHFWYMRPDPEINVGPFIRGDQIFQNFEHAPVPRDIQEMKRYIRVVQFEDENRYYWPGDWLSDFPGFLKLDEKDLAAFQDWLALPARVRFLEKSIEHCRTLATRSQGANGFAA